MGCSGVPWGHSGEVRGWRSAMKQTRRAGWQAWENLYRHHSVKRAWFILGLKFKNTSQVCTFSCYFMRYLFYQDREWFLPCLGLQMLGISIWFCWRKKEIPAGEIYAHHVSVTLPNSCLNRDQSCDHSFISQTACLPCPQHYQEYLSFLFNVLKVRKKQKQLISSHLWWPSPCHFWDVEQIHRLLGRRPAGLSVVFERETLNMFSVWVELSVLWHCQGSRSSRPLTRSLCPSISSVLLRSAPLPVRDTR